MLRLLIMVSFVCVCTHAASFGNISGTVSDMFGKPVAHASVKIADKQCKTDMFGKYSIECIQCQKAGVIVTADTFREFNRSVAVYRGPNIINFKLESILSIQETPEQLETPSDFTDIDNKIEEKATTPAVQQRSQPRSPNYWGSQNTVKDFSEMAKIIEKTADTVEVEGIIVCEQTGKPISNAVVNIGGHKEITDSEGSYRFKDLPKGKHSVMIISHTHKTKKTQVNIKEKSNLDFILTSKE